MTQNKIKNSIGIIYLNVGAKNILGTTKYNILTILYGSLHVCTKLHNKLQVISFAKSDLKGIVMFPAVLHELCQGLLNQSYLYYGSFLLRTILLGIIS